MKYLLVFYFAGFFLADASQITKYKLSLEPKEDEFQGTVTLTLNDINNHEEVELDPYTYTVTKCTYTGIDDATPTTTPSTSASTTTTSTTTTSTTTPSTNASTATPSTNASTATPSTNASTTTPSTSASTTTTSTTTPSTSASTTTTSTTTPSTNASTATPSTNASTATPSTNASTATPSTNASTATPSTNASTATSTATPTTTPSTTTSTTTPSPEKEQTCTFEKNKIRFHGNRTGEEVVLKFKGKYQKQGLSGYKAGSDRFYVADMTAENHRIIFPCRKNEKAEFEFAEDGEVMSNLENLRKKDGEKKIFLRDLTFVQGDIVKDNKSFPYYRMKHSEKMGEKLKSVMEKVAKLDPDLQILFTPVEEEIPIIPRDVIILSNVELKSNDSGSNYTDINRKLVDKWFQRPKGEKKTFFDIVGPKFTLMKIFGIIDIPFEREWKFRNIHALEEDGFNNSRSLNELASNNQESGQNRVLVAKGISVLYSLESICGDEKFMSGLSNYTSDGTSKVNEAFEGCFEDKGKAAEFFKVWTDDPGYPVVHVMLNKPAEYVMNQERFLWFGSEQKDRRWIIPIDYKTKEGSEKSIKLPATKNNVTETINSTYFILNHNNKGFYRVNYDAKLWEALTSQLKSNHSAIDPVSRTKLIDDVFSFPKSIYHYNHGIPDYVTALKLSEYLKNETDFWTLKVAFHALDFLDSALNGSNHGEFRDHMKGILNVIYNKTTKVEDPELQIQVNRTACKFGVKECMKNAMETFRNIKSNATKLSAGEKIAICSVVRNDSTKWMDSFALLTAMGLGSSEKNSLLACSRDEKILSLLLAQFFTQNDKKEFERTVTWAMEYNSDNIKSILNIIRRFEDAITKIFGKEFLQKILRLTFPKLNSESAVTLKEIAKNLDEQFKKDVDTVCNNVKVWTDTKAKSVGEYFKGKGKGSGSQAKPIALVLLMTTLLPLANHIFHS